ncbi:MAG: nucleotide sugar dehydrogenase, partial [Calditerrivibrio sp.]|nr:nucleotide sugar dehydrogenase [Calditerrivibrio sp.]
DIINELKEFGINTFVYDPKAYRDEVIHEYGLELLNDINEKAPYDAVIIAVKHREFLDFGLENIKSLMENPIVIDVKGLFSDIIDKNCLYWSL